MVNFIDLSKEISYILRHNPQKYNISLDSGGWADINELLTSLNKIKKWEKITLGDIQIMIEQSDKKRHEVKNDKIRAVYGHSIKDKIDIKPTCPPDILYHGTPNKFVELIKQNGLISKNRQYVHLSTKIETAINVGKRRDEQPVVLKIDAKKAFDNGVNFFYGNEDIWLSDNIPSRFIEID